MRKLLLSICGLFVVACTQSPKASPVAAPEKNYFAETKGCFLLYNMQTKVMEKTIGGENCKEELPACSTFKVPLAVMAFDSHALKDENQILKWDGTNYVRPVLNKDHNAKTWMQDSRASFNF